MSKITKKIKEKLVNIPNSFTMLRVILTFLILGMYFHGYSVLTILVIFVFAALTDFVDGFTARRYKQETLFGAKFDIFADRLLWIVFGVILFFGYDLFSSLGCLIYFSLLFSREIICGVFLVFYLIFSKNGAVFPYVRWSGKVVTTLQGIAIPSFVLSFNYSFFSFYLYLIPVTFVVGLFSAFYYIVDLSFTEAKRKKFLWGFYEKINPVPPAEYNKKH